MADNISVKISPEGISANLVRLLDRGRLVQGWLNRVTYPMVVGFQRERWMTEGASEGAKWEPLKSESYAKLKLKKFAGAPGGGRKLLIATGRLVDSMTGDNQADHWKLVTSHSLEVGTEVSYARYVNQNRSIVNLSAETISTLKQSLTKYLTGRA